MTAGTAKTGKATEAHLGRLERRAEALRERIAARGGATAATSADEAELESLEAAIALVASSRWRRAADEPIPPDTVEILASVVDQDATLLLRRSTSVEWRCECGCERVVAEDRVYRWRPLAGTRPAADSGSPIVSPASYRGRKRLAIIDDRIRYLTSRAAELKQKGSPARYEKDELEALAWIRELALRAGTSI